MLEADVRNNVWIDEIPEDFFFLLDYMVVMGLLVFVGHYLIKGPKRIEKKKKNVIPVQFYS